MLKVYKRNGTVEYFSQRKLKTSLLNTGQEINFTLNQRETELLIEDIENKIKSFRGEDGFTSTYEIGAIVIDTLRNMSYRRLANKYYENRHY